MVVIVGIFIKIISKGGFVNEKGRVVSCSCKLGTGPCVSAVAEFVAWVMFDADAVGLWTVDDWAGVKFIDSGFIKYIFKLLEAE